MNISSVKTFKKLGKAFLSNANPNKKWDIEFEPIEKSILTNPSGRVYCIVVNGKVYKIGGSICKGGIKKTFTTYRDLGLTGKPSIRTYGIHLLIEDELKRGNDVEFYWLSSNKVVTKVPGLHGYNTEEVSIDFKRIEQKCISEYIKREGSAPQWNFQENHVSWPIEISEGLNTLLRKTTKRAKTNLKDV